MKNLNCWSLGLRLRRSIVLLNRSEVWRSWNGRTSKGIGATKVENVMGRVIQIFSARSRSLPLVHAFLTQIMWVAYPLLKREHILIENDIPRGKDFLFLQVIHTPTLLTVRIAQKITFDYGAKFHDSLVSFGFVPKKEHPSCSTKVIDNVKKIVASTKGRGMVSIPKITMNQLKWFFYSCITNRKGISSLFCFMAYITTP